MSMNIYAEEGVKVIFANPNNGMKSDQERANLYLEVGKEYTVNYTVVEGWRTEVWLKEVPIVSFNSVMFENIN